MGYYTHYKLVVKNEDHPQHEKFVEWIENEPEPDDGSYRLHDFWTDEAESCKWYDHEKEVAAMSKQFPELIFVLSGEGEESGDIWIKYFKDGKVQTCLARIVYDDYDEKKLEVPKRT